MSKQAVKRIATRDMKEISNMNLNDLGIYVHFNEENIMEAYALIIGPKDTPYENGILYFIINFPSNYPFSPPKVQYYSTSKYRIHPNLYVGRSHNNFLGKVCLSAINTWSGPKWTSIMHIGSVLLSIQSLLDNNPLNNEPGFENERGKRNDIYNEIVKYDTYQQLILRNCSDIPPNFKCFEGIIRDHLKREKINILEKITKLSQNKINKEKLSINIYNLSVVVDYNIIKEKIITMLQSY
jgi:ubiquitin-conjugating enzyme E2 O